MTRDEIRLELVRLAHRHDQIPDVVIDRAKQLEQYVLSSEGTEDAELTPVTASGKRPKKTGSADSLS